MIDTSILLNYIIHIVCSYVHQYIGMVIFLLWTYLDIRSIMISPNDSDKVYWSCIPWNVEGDFISCYVMAYYYVATYTY